MPFLATHCISVFSIYSKKRRLGGSSARGRGRGAKEAPLTTWEQLLNHYSLQAYCNQEWEKGIKTNKQEENKHTSCSSKCKRTSRKKIPCYYLRPPAYRRRYAYKKNQIPYKMQETTKQSIRRIKFETLKTSALPKKKRNSPTADTHPHNPEAKGSAVSHFQVLMFHHIGKQFDPKRQSEKQQKEI